jgi:hypothetical protein
MAVVWTRQRTGPFLPPARMLHTRAIAWRTAGTKCQRRPDLLDRVHQRSYLTLIMSNRPTDGTPTKDR